jgi:hypothetical protein
MTQRYTPLIIVVALFLGIKTAGATPIIVNGDFETGDLTGWTAFTTPLGTNGGPGFPNVVSFDTTGTGASFAAHFDVGSAITPSGEQGGGIKQTFLAPVAGTYAFSAAIASQDDKSGAGPNADAGAFSLLIDGITIATDDLGGFSTRFQILRGSLNGTDVLGVGSHTIALEITRDFVSADTNTPEQYIDNVTAASPSVAAVPEPTSLALLGTGIVGFYRLRRRAPQV